MLEQDAIVDSVAGDFARVVAQPQAACNSCNAGNACGTSLLARLLPARKRQFLVRNTVGAAPGDRVVIGLDESALQTISLLLYLLPLVGLIGGGVLGLVIADTLRIADQEPISITVALLGIAIAFYLVRIYSERIQQGAAYEARIIQVKSHVVTLGTDNSGL